MLKRAWLRFFIAVISVIRYGLRQHYALDTFLFDVAVAVSAKRIRSIKAACYLYRLRRRLRRQLYEFAKSLNIAITYESSLSPIETKLPGKTQRKVGEYSYTRKERRAAITLLYETQDDLWVLAHEVGHHFALAYGDGTEAGANQAGRDIIRMLVKNDFDFISPIAEVHLPTLDQRDAVAYGFNIDLPSNATPRSYLIVGALVTAVLVRSSAASVVIWLFFAAVLFYTTFLREGFYRLRWANRRPSYLRDVIVSTRGKRLAAIALDPNANSHEQIIALSRLDDMRATAPWRKNK